MKVWKSFSAEHSANLRIVGTFKTAQDAQRAADFFNGLLAIVNKVPDANRTYSEDVLEYVSSANVGDLSAEDVKNTDLFDQMQPAGKTIDVRTEDTDIQVIVKTFLDFGAKVEIFSLHDYELDGNLRPKE